MFNGEQLDLALEINGKRTWGGRRAGAGRKKKKRPDGERKNVPHRTRAKHCPRCPVHATLRAVRGRGVPSFRSQLVWSIFNRVLRRQRKRKYDASFHVIDYTLQVDHVHLIVEAVEDPDTLRAGLSGFAISFAKQLNAALGRSGPVWDGRHDRRDLTSPTEVRRALVYVFQNFKHHCVRVFGRGFVDHFSSAVLFDGWDEDVVTYRLSEPWLAPRPPRTWLRREGWRRVGDRFLHTWDLTAKAARRIAAERREGGYQPASCEDELAAVPDDPSRPPPVWALEDVAPTPREVVWAPGPSTREAMARGVPWERPPARVAG